MKLRKIISVFSIIAATLVSFESYGQDSTDINKINRAQADSIQKKNQDMQYHKNVMDNAKEASDESKSKAKEAKRVEKDATDASDQSKKALKEEKKAQRAREKANRQAKKAAQAREKSDKN